MQAREWKVSGSSARRAGRAGVLQARVARSAQAGERQACGAGRRAGRGRAQQQARAREAWAWLGAGRATCAHGLGQLGARAPGLVFSLVFRLGIFPESLNEHCSL